MAKFTAEDELRFQAMVKANAFKANRRLSDRESVQFDRYTPTNWFQQLPLIPKEETPPKSGFGYTQSPYISQWTKMWGVSQLTDLAKYRMMYRTVPIIKKAIDKTVATAISKGFNLELPHDADNREEILFYLKSWLDTQQDFKLHLQMLASDALVYGNAYAEIVYDETEGTVSEEYSSDPEFQRVEIPDPAESYKMGDTGIPSIPSVTYNGNGKYIKVAAKGNPVWIKPLDPLWMRVRRDSFSNIFGYLQYLSTPPVAFTNDKILHIKFNAKSWWTENAYGTSNLMALVRTQEAIWTIENDLILISHACAKPPLIFSCGKVQDEPWTESQFTNFVSATSSRGPGGDIYHRGDVESKPLPFPASSLAPLLAHLDYHVEQRMIILGVPPDLLGIHASSNRSTAMVTMDDWINTIQLLQQQIGDAIQEQLFKPIIEKVFGEGSPIPKMVWNQVYEKDDQAEIEKIMILRNANIITTNEAREWLNEVGKKLEPVTDGDSLLPPQAFIPTEQQKESESNMPDDDSIFEESASFKGEEYSDIKINKVVPPPKKSKPLSDEYKTIRSYSDPDLPSGKGYPLKEAVPIPTSKTFFQRAASHFVEPKADPLEDQQPKDLTSVKIEKIGEKEGVEIWKVSGDKVAARYSKDWKHEGSDGEHDYIGGHHYVFDYIPENEIWVSDLDETPDSTALHEFVERKAMKEDGLSYADAHKKALKAEGLPEQDISNREYITPQEVKEKLDQTYSKNENKTWQMAERVITYDDVAGIIYVKEGDKVIDQLLVRSMNDLETFINKLDEEFRK